MKVRLSAARPSSGLVVASLAPHPSSLDAPVGRFTVDVAATATGAIALSFGVEGAIDRLRIPSPAEARRTDGLWRHTCFEAFLMAGSGPAYRELNFSPSGEWAAYAFVRYRDGGPLDVELEPAVVVHRDRDRLQVDAVVPAAGVPRAGSGSRLRLGLAAVLEDVDGTLSYWALRHPADRPDFHHADGFGVDVTLP